METDFNELTGKRSRQHNITNINWFGVNQEMKKKIPRRPIFENYANRLMYMLIYATSR